MWKKKPKERTIFVSNYISNVLPFLKKQKDIKKVLDVACGNGLGVSLPLLRAGYNVYAFDKYSSGVNATRKNANNEGFKINVKKANMYKKFPYRDNSFDASFCFQAIYHGRIEKIIFALSEMKRVTKKGGFVFVTFLPYEDLFYDKKAKKYFIYFRSPKTKRIGKSYMRQDKHHPHLFYFLGGWEPNVPHYFASKEEVKIFMDTFFKDIKITKVKKNPKDKWFSWLAWGRVA